VKHAGSWAARCWLGLLFWCTWRAPIVPRALKPVILFFAWRSSAPVRAATLANARRILGEGSTARERRALGRGVLESFYEMVLDFGRNRRLTGEEILAKIERVEGLEGYERARKAGRGAILVTAHMGPFETAVWGVAQRERRVHVLFRRDVMSAFERLRSEQRRRLGVIEAPVDEGMKTWFSLRDALLADEVVLMQGDRTMPGQKGVRLPVLHGLLEIPEGPVKLAIITGAPIIPTFAVMTGEKGRMRGLVRIMIGEPIMVGGGAGEAEAAMVHLAGRIEAKIREFPEQWLMLEKAWAEDREREVGDGE